MAPRRSLLAALAPTGARTCALAALLALAACNTTPTLPLPPPVVSLGESSQTGFVRVSGQALERAYVSVLNNDTDQGVITRADDDGAFATEIAASPGDRLTVYQELAGEVGEQTEIGVPEP